MRIYVTETKTLERGLDNRQLMGAIDLGEFNTVADY